jgi:hypothetical protein
MISAMEVIVQIGVGFSNEMKLEIHWLVAVFLRLIKFSYLLSNYQYHGLKRVDFYSYELYKNYYYA